MVMLSQSQDIISSGGRSLFAELAYACAHMQYEPWIESGNKWEKQ